MSLLLKRKQLKTISINYQRLNSRICTKWSLIKTYLNNQDPQILRKQLMPNTIIKVSLTLSSLHGTKEKTLGTKLNMMHPTQLNLRPKLNSKLKELITPSLNKDKIIKINKIFIKIWLNLNRLNQWVKLLKNTTNSILSKLPSTTSTDYLRKTKNTITPGKPNPSFSLTSKEITPGTSMNTITPTGKNIKEQAQQPTNKVLNSKTHIQRLRTHQEVLIQRMNL